MQVVYSDQPPVFGPPSIFLAGPTPRSKEVASWRVAALRILEEKGFAGAVLVPEAHDWVSAFDYDHQVEWEYTCNKTRFFNCQLCSINTCHFAL